MVHARAMLCCRPRVVGPLSALAGFHRYEGVEDCDDNLSEFDWSLPEHANSVGGGSFNTPPSVDTANAAPAATFLALKFTAQHISGTCLNQPQAVTQKSTMVNYISGPPCKCP
mmetsp:Transcript_26257/g.87497  ORF Transcript_26257/g.87497 Transcript_26257/m.87497 type:complete len:113 (-) Transcript_26257:277-615(-)